MPKEIDRREGRPPPGAVNRSRESEPVSAAQIRFLNQLRARARSDMDVDTVKTVGEFVRAKNLLEGLIRARRKK